MKYFFTADTHFFHARIIGYCTRPFKTVEEMNEKIIANWNQAVKPEDVVFHLGDFAFKDHKELLNRLNGTVVFIRGNHDKVGILIEAWIEFAGETWCMVHDPASVAKDIGKYILCGHVHEKWKVQKRKDQVFVNVGVDVWDFRPVQMKGIIKLLKKEGLWGKV
jgi:calcineurin-like phosphoesterase family protein